MLPSGLGSPEASDARGQGSGERCLWDSSLRGQSPSAWRQWWILVSKHREIVILAYVVQSASAAWCLQFLPWPQAQQCARARPPRHTHTHTPALAHTHTHTHTHTFTRGHTHSSTHMTGSSRASGATLGVRERAWGPQCRWLPARLVLLAARRSVLSLLPSGAGSPEASDARGQGSGERYLWDSNPRGETPST